MASPFRDECVCAQFDCCGVTTESYRDWNQNIHHICDAMNPDARTCAVPTSCCQRIIRQQSNMATVAQCGKGVLVKSVGASRVPD